MSQSQTSQNNLIDVATLSNLSTPFLANDNPWVGAANRKYDSISGIPGQLGATANIRLPIQATAARSLKWNTQGLNQTYQPISINKPFSSSMAVETTQFMFNVENYLDTTARPMVSSIASDIGKDVARLAITNTYRFFGSPDVAFSSLNDIGLAKAQFKNYGSAKMGLKCILQDLTISQICQGNSNLFTPETNDKLINSWEIGSVGDCKMLETNIIAKHIAGTEGNEGTPLTVVSLTTNASNQITAITFSGCSSASDSNSIKENDRLYFIPTDGYQTPYFMTYNDEIESGNVVQLRSTSDAASTSGSQVTVNISPPLASSTGATPANITTPIQVGMRVQVLKNFKAGLMYSGDALYVAIPPMPGKDPYTSHVATDKDSGVSMLFSSGWMLDEPVFKFGYTAVAGYTLIPQMAMAMIQPY